MKRLTKKLKEEIRWLNFNLGHLIIRWYALDGIQVPVEVECEVARLRAHIAWLEGD